MTHFGRRFDRIVGTTRTAERAALLAAQRFGERAVEMLVFDGTVASDDLKAAVASADALLVSAAPTEAGDPVLVRAGSADRVCVPRSQAWWFFRRSASTRTPAVPGSMKPRRSCAAARGAAMPASMPKQAWQALGARRDLPVAILRLGGIYGPGQNAMLRLLRGSAQRVAKPGHVSNRIHVYDIAQAIDAAFALRANGIFNIVDDEPAPPTDQIAFAAQLLGIEPPAEIPYADAAKHLSPFALSFYDGCIRARNDKLKRELGVTLRYPNYREGLRALHAAGDHLAARRSFTSP